MLGRQVAQRRGHFDGATVRLFIDGKEVGTGAGDGRPVGYDTPSGNTTSAPTSAPAT